MFASKNEIQSLGRLKKRSDFLCVQQQGRKWVAQGLIVQLRENSDLGLRYGLTVSKKVHKSAVVRNRIKRRLKSVVCDVLPSLGQQNIDIILVGRTATLEREYADLQRDLRWCFKKMDIKINKGT